MHLCRHNKSKNCTRENPKKANDQYSLGIFAGRYCEDCWKKSGYRKEGPEGFDPMYAGESYEES